MSFGTIECCSVLDAVNPRLHSECLREHLGSNLYAECVVKSLHSPWERHDGSRSKFGLQVAG